MPFEIIVPPGSEALYSDLHFAQATSAGGLILCSGQIGTDENGKIPESAEDEFRRAWQKVRSVVQAAGASMADIVEISSFHVGLRANLGTFMKVKDEFVKEPYPAWTAVGVTELAVEGARVEIRVVCHE